MQIPNSIYQNQIKVSTFKDRILNQYRSFSDSNIQTDKLAQLDDLDLPTHKHEDWKYTPLKSFASDIAKITMKPEFIDLDLNSLKIPQLEGYYCFFVNGYFIDQYSTLPPKLEVSCSNFSDTKLQSKDFLYNLNILQATEGLTITCPKNLKTAKPLIFIYLNYHSKSPAFCQVRNKLNLEEHSELSLIEYFIDSNGSKSLFTNSLTQIEMASNSRLKHNIIENIGAANLEVHHTQVNQGRESHYSNTTICLSGKMIRNNLNIRAAQACQTDMYGFYLSKDRDHVDNHTSVDHLDSNSTSNQLYKGVLLDRAQAVFNGKIFVRQAAQQTQAFQSNRNILLSDDAVINTKPQLEIWADNVKCSHGATTGFLEETDIFYLRSRGISKQKAYLLLLTAFLQETLTLIDPILQDFLGGLIEQILTSKLE